MANLPKLDVLGSQLLSRHLRKDAVDTLGNVYGSWCCRPNKDPKDMPNSHSFRLLDTEVCAFTPHELPRVTVSSSITPTTFCNLQ